MAEKPIKLQVKVQFEQIKTIDDRKVFADTFSKNIEQIFQTLQPEGISYIMLSIGFAKESHGKDGLEIDCNFGEEFTVDSSGKTLADVINMCCAIALKEVEIKENSCSCSEHKEENNDDDIMNERKKRMGLN